MQAMTSLFVKTTSAPSRFLGTPWVPRKEQVKAVAYLLDHGEAGVFGEPGTGKTSIILAAIKVLLKHRLCKRVVIIAPLRVIYQVWPAEIKHWQDFTELRCHILHDKGKQDFFLEQDFDIFLINPEGLPWLAPRIKQLNAQVLVVDESSRFKGWMTQRMKLLKKMLPTFKRRWIATGSPTPKSYLDLFPQMFILDLGKAFGPYITHFRSRFFFNPDHMGWDWKLNNGAEKEIQKMIRPYILRMENKELPAVQENIIRVDLPKDARRVYDELEEEFITQLNNGEFVTALSAGTATMRLCQIANGSLYYEKDFTRKVATLHSAKVEALQELIDEISSPLLVGYEFKHDLQRIAEELFPKIPLAEVPYIGGGVTPRRAAELERLWNAGDLPLLMGHPASMGHGLNLQASGCHHVAWFGINWDWELVDQMIRRVRRPGNQHADVFVHYITANATVDEAKLKNLNRKKKSQDGLLEALREYARNRSVTGGR
jgi:SNF2 family DNA or RNA helicase